MIPFFDFRPHYRMLRPEIDAAIQRVLDSGQLILGPEVEAFEHEFADFVGSRGAVGVNSGTDALILALRCLGIGPGDEVITVANAGVPPVAAVRAVGAVPRFVDVSPRTLSLAPKLLEHARTARTRCVLPVHLYGHPASMAAVLEFAALHEVPVVEDCAQAHGARIGGRHVGTFGRMGCFSFYPTKNLGAFGDGGAVVSCDPAVLERLRMLRTYGFREDRSSHIEGVNSRLDELQAAVLRVKLTRLSEDLGTRQILAAHYRDGLSRTALTLPEAGDDLTHAFHLLVVRSRNRARLIQALESRQIGYGLHYAEPVHLMPAYAFLGHSAGQLPATEAACREVLSLPLYVGLEHGAVDQVVETLSGAA